MYLNQKEMKELCHIVHFISFAEGCRWHDKLLTEKESIETEQRITTFAINEIKKQKAKK